MKSLNHYARFPLSAVLATTVAMFGIIRSNDSVSQATLSAFAAEQPASQWRQTSGPEGAAIISLLSDGSKLFAGTYAGGLFRSSNQGESWTALNTGLSGQSVQALVAVGTNLFAGTDGGGVFRSNDQGESWTAVGPARVTITSGAGKASLGTALVTMVAPGLFAANGDGQSVAAGVALRIKADGSQSFEPIARFDPGQNRFVAAPNSLSRKPSL